MSTEQEGVEIAHRPNIYIFCTQRSEGWWLCHALAEDGKALAQHVSSNASWARTDMGLVGERKHSEYDAHYPQGYNLVDLVDANRATLDAHEGFQRAIEANKRNAPPSTDETES